MIVLELLSGDYSKMPVFIVENDVSDYYTNGLKNIPLGKLGKEVASWKITEMSKGDCVIITIKEDK